MSLRNRQSRDASGVSSEPTRENASPNDDATSPSDAPPKPESPHAGMLLLKIGVAGAAWFIIMILFFGIFFPREPYGQEYSQLRVLQPGAPAGFPFGDSFPFVIVSDLDANSRHPEKFEWHSIVKTGMLSRVPSKVPGQRDSFKVEWTGSINATTNMATNNRSVELSDIVWWNGRFVTACDYTGLIYTLRPLSGELFPRYVLADGDGKTRKTLKSEWMTVYKNRLYVGSHGKEWTQNGVVIARGAEWVKQIDTTGRIMSLDWGPRYQAIRRVLNATSPGYVSHEAVLWHEPAHLWVFLPRKCSNTDPFDDLADETKGCNKMVLVDEAFTTFRVVNVGPPEPTYGFTSIARIPGTSYMMATKVREQGDVTHTKVVAFDLEGNLLMEPFEAGHVKFEGIEFMSDVEST